MGKMTAEQFLEQLRITIWKPFKVDDDLFAVDEKYNIMIWTKHHYDLGWTDTAYPLSWLLGKEIKSVPQYKLTEDEKAIVRCISKEYKWIVRDKIYGLFVCTEKPFKASKQSLDWSSNDGNYLYMKMFVNVFNFIQWENDEPVSLDELRKGL